MSLPDGVFAEVRGELARRARRRLRSLSMGAGKNIRFFGARRGLCYRVARFKTIEMARRVGESMAVAREGLGDRVPPVLLEWVECGVVVSQLVHGRTAERLGPARLSRCVALLGALHSLDVARHRGLGPMRSCFRDRMDGLVHRAKHAPVAKHPPGFDVWMRRYEQLRLRAWPRALLHGDPHEENFVWTTAVVPTLIDWDLCMAGAPHFDLAYLVYWRADTLEAQKRPRQFGATLRAMLADYNGAARHPITLRDMLLWLGCVALGYIGFGEIADDDRYAPVAEWIWRRIDEVAYRERLTLDPALRAAVRV